MGYKNKEDQLECQRRWYARNKEKQKGWVRDRKRRLRSWLSEYKNKRGCSKCPENHPSCIEFHHDKGEKELAISNLVSFGCGKEKILKEIKKCTLLCANCHRKLHFKEGS